MNKNKINEMSFEKLSSIYSVVNELCSDFSRLTDGYSLATGDKMFEAIPEDIKNMINERQKFFSYRNIIKDALKNKIIKILEDDE